MIQIAIGTMVLQYIYGHAGCRSSTVGPPFGSLELQGNRVRGCSFRRWSEEVARVGLEKGCGRQSQESVFTGSLPWGPKQPKVAHIHACLARKFALFACLNP